MIQPARSLKITPTHLERKAIIYTLSRDFVGHMLALYATFTSLCIAQRNWRWTLQQPLKRWQKKRCLCEWLSCQCHQNHEIIHPAIVAQASSTQYREPAQPTGVSRARSKPGMVPGSHCRVGCGSGAIGDQQRRSR